MASDPAHSVVVGVDGSPEALVAARYALGAAVRRGLDVLLVYGYPLPLIEAPSDGGLPARVRAAGRGVLDDAVAALDIPPGVEVATEVGEMSPAELMQRLSRSAPLMVVGQHATAWYDRLGGGGVASPLAHRSGCPVVVVPPTWRRRSRERRPVLAALDGDLASLSALRFAFDEARMLASEVLVLHVLEDGSDEPDEVAGRNVSELLARVGPHHPGVPARIVRRRGDPRRVILRAAQDAAVLVVGPPRTTGPGVWSRSLARRVMTDVECPVVVVPSRRPTPAPREPGVLASW